MSERVSHPDQRWFSTDGEMWSVYEDASNSANRSLVFESEKIGRRVRNYPENWRELSDRDLYKLSWSV
jgi:hypothetical protein